MIRAICLAALTVISLSSSADPLGPHALFYTSSDGKIKIAVMRELGAQLAASMGSYTRSNNSIDPFDRVESGAFKCVHPASDSTEIAFCFIDIDPQGTHFSTDARTQDGPAHLEETATGTKLVIEGDLAITLSIYAPDLFECQQSSTAYDLPILNSILPETTTKTTACSIAVPKK